ncbi:beta-ketoacyl synthase N-terminal-like domain-containing protein [Nocardia takedensis]
MVLLTTDGRVADSVAITAWSAISPWGIGAAEFSAGLRSTGPTARRLDDADWEVPFRHACLVPDFDARTALGRKGTRSMDRMTALSVAAVGLLLDDGTGNRRAGVTDSAGLVLGTAMGSAQSMMSFTRDSLVEERPYLVNPAHFPNTVMNCAAGQSAIWHRLKGPNATVAGGRASGLLALRYALRLLRAGRTSTVLCGAVEEFSEARAWLEWHARGRPDVEKTVLGEGAAMWLLEDEAAARAHGRRILGVPRRMKFGFARTVDRIQPVLARCVRRVLEDSGTSASEIRFVVTSGADRAEGDYERAALAEVLETTGARDISLDTAIGDTSAASAAFQIVAALAQAEPGAPHQVVITSVEADGVVGAMLLEVRP